MKLLLLLVIYHLSLMTVYFKSGDRIPVGGEIFRTHPDQPCGPYLLYNGYQVSFLGGKSTEVWRWPPTWSSTKVKERVELYIYSPSGPLWPVLGWTLLMYINSTYKNTKARAALGHGPCSKLKETEPHSGLGFKLLRRCIKIKLTLL